MCVNMKNRLKKWGLCLLHNIVLILGVVATAIIQYLFAKDIATSGTGFIPINIYELNPITFLIGTALFVSFYNFLWKRWLKKDLIDNCKGQKGWITVYVILSLITLFTIFIAYLFVIIFTVGLFITITFPGEAIPYISIAYMIIYPIAEIIVSNKKKNLP